MDRICVPEDEAGDDLEYELAAGDCAALAMPSASREEAPGSEAHWSVGKSEATADQANCGTWLDEELRLGGAGGKAFLQATLSWVDALRGKPGSRRVDHRANFERRIECILANVLRARFFRQSDRVAYHSGNNAYLIRNRSCEGHWLSGASIRRDLSLLAEVCLIEICSGIWAGDVQGFGPGRSSTFRPRAVMDWLIRACGAHGGCVWKPLPPVESLIRLRATKDDEGNKRELPFEWNDELRQWSNELDRYNHFADAHEVWIGNLSTKEEKRFLAWKNRRQQRDSRQPGITHLETFNCHLKRIFNDGTFQHGGRLYGAWYQQVSSWLRERILIDDQETTELDYSGMSVRMLYHQAGIDYTDDPYSLPEVEAYAVKQGNPAARYRDSIKSVVQAMLNNEDAEKRAEMGHVDVPFPRKFTRAKVKELILDKHAAISDAFGSGPGKALQRLDSDIALNIITALMEQNILCLPIHDSFIVATAHEARLRQQMISSYRKRLGFDPIIK